MDSPRDAGGTTRKMRGRPRGWDDTGAAVVKSLDRAMAILDHLGQHSGLSLSTLAGDLGQSPATVYRVLVTLESRGLVELDRLEQHWHVGPRAFVIGAQFLRRTSLVERARPIMRRLMEVTGETANLGRVQGDSVLFLSQVETHEAIRAFFPPGTLSPLHASGIGKALLAEMPAARVAGIAAASGLPGFTPKTLQRADALAADLAATRARGHAIDDEERNVGMRCIAAPVFDVHGEAVAGISVSGPTSRMDRDRSAPIAAAVMSAAAELTVAIAGVAPIRPPA
ncbi:IclR family transcriptional regulator [Palleronia sediminis]|uniref:IclR family transcriptional regulator n=1 Tax=Palleronia sediminis TaxID=2547833 RepID=A0A4V3B8V2_9RHOB|nr:HTH-type transcriptional regulator BhcR [Palleronia sediminis]TDL76549.1 IclR family transcriptional regulator [Palleronia sediminis]